MLNSFVGILSTILLSTLVYADELTQIKTYEPHTGISLIAIDPGFGGKSTGPSGCDGRELAKNINLRIAKKVAKRITAELGINVILTRENDVDLSLEERCAFANNNKADLLISIHTNGSKQYSVSGIETFYMDFSTEPQDVKISMENTADPEKNAMMNTILMDFLRKSKVEKSEFLALNVHKHLYRQLSKSQSELKNRGVKKAPFYILLCTVMPSILIQAGFITNPDECNLLSSDEYQQSISNGIVDGLNAFIKRKRTQQTDAPYREN
jgi:N-acetylmuramoyl-L-alanine amidase